MSVAFNGFHSLSIQYLLSLGLELILNAATPGACERFLRDEIRHDLIKALDEEMIVRLDPPPRGDNIAP